MDAVKHAPATKATHDRGNVINTTVRRVRCVHVLHNVFQKEYCRGGVFLNLFLIEDLMSACTTKLTKQKH